MKELVSPTVRSVALLALLVPLFAAHTLAAADQSTLLSQIRELYLELAKVSEVGVNVDPQIKLLNEALQMIQNGSSPERVEALIQEVNSSIPQLEEEASALYLESEVVKFSVVAVIIVVGLLAYYFAPRLFWKAWARLRRGWVVE